MNESSDNPANLGSFAAPLTVSYENTVDDLIALSKHQLSTDAAFLRRRRGNLIGSLLGVVAAFSYFAWRRYDPRVLIGVGFMGLAVLLWKLLAYRKLTPKLVAKMLRDTPQKNVFCRHTVSISGDGIGEETEGAHNFHTWPTLFRIAITPEHIFVYNTPATAHIIPRRELGDERFAQVSEEIRSIPGANLLLGTDRDAPGVTSSR